MKAREVVHRGRALVLAQRGTTAATALVSALAVLIAAVTWHEAGEVARVGLAHRNPSLIGRALLTLLIGGGVAGLSVAMARAAALARQAGGSLLEGVSRTPAMISVVAVELTVEGMLLLGVVLVVARHRSAVPSTAAWQGAIVTAPALLLFAAMFAAARVAVCLAARGVAPAPALARGFDLVARRWRALLRLGLRLAIATLPLTLGALLLAMGATRLGPAGALVADQLRAVLLAVAWLWSYAALGVLADDAA